MKIDWGGLIIGILTTCLSYMLVPIILKLKTIVIKVNKKEVKAWQESHQRKKYHIYLK